MKTFQDVSYYEQKLETLETETQATYRRFCSVQRARRENSLHTASVLHEFTEIQQLGFDCSWRTLKDPSDELQQELDGLKSKERQLAAILDQCLQVDKRLSGNDLNFAPLLTDLRKQCSETRDQLKVSRQRKAQEQTSFRETLSGAFLEMNIDHGKTGFKISDR